MGLVNGRGREGRACAEPVAEHALAVRDAGIQHEEEANGDDDYRGGPGHEQASRSVRLAGDPFQSAVAEASACRSFVM